MYAYVFLVWIKFVFSHFSSPGWIYATCLVMVVIEAYLLRLRHVIAGAYFPQREKLRAAWLYSHILRRRGSVLKSLRRDVKINFKKQLSDEKITLMGRLTAK